MSGFRMYITTKLGNPSYTPEVRTDLTSKQPALYLRHSQLIREAKFNCLNVLCNDSLYLDDLIVRIVKSANSCAFFQVIKTWKLHISTNARWRLNHL